MNGKLTFVVPKFSAWKGLIANIAHFYITDIHVAKICVMSKILEALTFSIGRPKNRHYFNCNAGMI
jgi:hypothetical protein